MTVVAAGSGSNPSGVNKDQTKGNDQGLEHLGDGAADVKTSASSEKAAVENAGNGVECGSNVTTEPTKFGEGYPHLFRVGEINSRFEGCNDKFWKAVGVLVTGFIGTIYYTCPLISFVFLPLLLLYTRFSIPTVLFACLWLFLSAGPVCLSQFCGACTGWDHYNPLPQSYRQADTTSNKATKNASNKISAGDGVISLISGKVFGSVALWLNGEVMSELSVQELNDHPKPILFLVFPHGVISFGGWCFGTICISKMRRNYTAGADVLLSIPMLRHIFHHFKIISGSRASITSTLRGGSDVCLYPGGLAELFLNNRYLANTPSFDKRSSTESAPALSSALSGKRKGCVVSRAWQTQPNSSAVENLYFNSRKGCIKVAMEGGADIAVVYLFGNSNLYQILKSEMSIRISRFLRASVSPFWGSLWTPVPFKTDIKIVISKIIPTPTVNAPKPTSKMLASGAHDLKGSGPAITPEMISQHHSVVKAEIKRVFDTYKGCHRDYEGRELVFF